MKTRHENKIVRHKRELMKPIKNKIKDNDLVYNFQ